VSDAEGLVRAAYEAFNARDLDAALALMHPDVDWPNAWEGGRVRGQSDVRAYWERQFAAIDPRVDPETIDVEDAGRVSVRVHQVVRDPQSGQVVADDHVIHRYVLRDGLIERMDVEAAA
jgi:ketosteroid isomerase-like protein